MPILRFQIRDTGPISYAALDDLPSIVILAGPNGVGKSTLLERLRKPGEGITVKGNEKFLYVSPYRTPGAYSLHKSLPVIGPSTRMTDVLTSDSFAFPYYSIPGHSLPQWITSGGPRSRSTPDFAPYFEVKYKLVQFQHEFDLTLREIFEKHSGEIPKGIMPMNIYEPFRNLVRKLLPGIEFDGIVVEGETYKVNFINRFKKQVEFDQLSSGEKDIIAVLFPFIEKEIENSLSKVRGKEAPHESLVVLVDTPEAYLHPALQRSLLEYLRNSVEEATERNEELQFILATHSTTIINDAKPEELYIMMFPDQSGGGNQISKIVTEEEKLHLLRDVLGDIGLASLATGKPIILVEGKNDIEILRLLLPRIEDEFTLLAYGGKDEITVFSMAFEKILPELVARGFRIFAILDRDTRAPGPEHEFLLTWTRSCLENFLLLDSAAIGDALRVVVGEKKLQDLNAANVKDIDGLIMSIVADPETLKVEIKRRIGSDLRFYIDDEWENIEKLRAVAAEALDKRLKRITDRFEMIDHEVKSALGDREKALADFDGKLILGKMASRFGVKRELLARAIADKLRDSDRVPQGILDVIERIRRKCH